MVKLTYPYCYQQAGDAKKPYLAQYSGVRELPVNTLSTALKNNIAIKITLSPIMKIQI